MQGMFKQGITELDLFIERRTARCLDNKHYFIFQKGRLMGRHLKKEEAQAQYEQLRDATGWRPPGKPVIDVAEIVAKESQDEHVARAIEYWMGRECY